MVHALDEIRRILVPDGILIDLRPILDRWQIEFVSARESRATGQMQGFPLGLADDEAANRSMRVAEENGWFKREQQEYFPYIYSWDSAGEMEKWIEDEWAGYIEPDEETKQRTRSAWALGNADSRVRVQVKMSIARWRKL
ncbi:MAG TPA: hypothetical protein VJ785_03305 [Anaerolineales bacterium]|nr:hypothetical protein [Anaerolineales bacterium]